MANSYTLFSESIDNLTEEESKWWNKILDGIGEVDFEFLDPLVEWECIDFQYRFEGEGSSLWIFSDECGVVDQVICLVREFLSLHRPGEVFTLSWADTCSSPRLGEFGGGAVIVTAEGADWVNTWAWLAEKKKERDGKTSKTKEGA